MQIIHMMVIFLIIQHSSEVEIIDTHTGEVVTQFDSVTSAVSPVNDKIAVAERNGTLRIRTIPEGAIIASLRAHSGLVYDLKFSKDGSLLISAGEDCKLLYGCRTGEYLHRLDPVWFNAHGEEFTNSRIFIHHFELIPETNQIVGYGSWGVIASWEASTGNILYVVTKEMLSYYPTKLSITLSFHMILLFSWSRGFFLVREIFMTLLQVNYWTQKIVNIS